MDTIEDAWARLDSKYASTAIVSSNLINGFIEFKLTAKNDARKMVELEEVLMTLYYDLRAIKQEDQVTQNIFLLQQAVQKIQKDYQAKYAAASMEKENLPGQTQWRIVTEFLKLQRDMLERHTPWALEERTAKKTGHKTRHCSRRSGNRINALAAEERAMRIESVGGCALCTSS